LSSSKEISSTEKLLDVIRNDSQPGEISETPVTLSSPKPANQNISEVFSKKSVSVGVEIGLDELKLVKVNRLSGGQWELLDYTKIPLKAGISIGTPAFAGFLKSELTRFCGSGKAFHIWGLIHSDRVDVQNIRIPKVGRKQLENAVSWTVKKNTPFNEETTILDFEIQGDVIESGVRKLSVLVCTAPKPEVEEMRELFHRIGFPLTGITAMPFAIQNLFRASWISSVDQIVATLYIGDDSSRIDIFSGGDLTMSRVIKAGINSMADSLVEEYAAFEKNVDSASGISPGEDTASGPAPDIMTQENAKTLISTLASGSDEEDARFGLTGEKILEMIKPALERLVGQIDRTFEHYAAILGNDRVSFVYVFCDMDICESLTRYIGDELRMGSEMLDPLSPENSYSGEATSDTPVVDRISFVSTLGLALSDPAYTLNLIFPFGDKETFKSIRRFNRAILLTFMVVMVVLFGIFFWLDGVADHKANKLAALENQMNNGIRTIENPSRTLISEVTENRFTLERFIDRYFGLAIIQELSKLTPEKVSLLSAKAGVERAAVKGKDKKVTRGMTVEGVVEGVPGSLEPVLAKYVLALSKSPIFKEVSIDKSTVGPFHANEALHFTLFVGFAEELK